jgi:hypothetical protein
VLTVFTNTSNGKKHCFLATAIFGIYCMVNVVGMFGECVIKNYIKKFTIYNRFEIAIFRL